MTIIYSILLIFFIVSIVFVKPVLSIYAFVLSEQKDMGPAKLQNHTDLDEFKAGTLTSLPVPVFFGHSLNVSTTPKASRHGRRRIRKRVFDLPADLM